MLAVLLLIELLLLVFLFCRFEGALAGWTCKERLVGAYVLLLTVLCGIAELLSLVSLLTPEGITAFHLVFTALLVLIAISLRKRKSFCVWKGEVWLLAFALLLTVPAIVSGVYAPPNNWDSMTYHIPRIYKWLHHHSLDHYPTYVSRQLYQNPGHEFVLTHLLSLSGTHRYVAVFNNMTFMMSFIASAAIVERIGGSRLAQYGAMLLLATLPGELLQAATPQNDLLLSFFLLTFVLGGLLLRKTEGSGAEGLLWLSGALAVLTKGPAFLYLPIVALFFFPFRRYLKRKFLLRGFAFFLVALLLNAGHWSRNYEAFEHPLGPTDGPHNIGTYSVKNPSFNSTISILLRNMALHAHLPFVPSEERFKEFVKEYHLSHDLKLNDPKTTWRGPSFRKISAGRPFEDEAGNGMHFVLILLSCVIYCLAYKWRFRGRGEIVLPLLVFVVGFLFVSIFLKWQIWGTRLHLPLFVVAIPSVSVVLASVLPRLLIFPLFGLLLYSAYGYWAKNELRPFVGDNSIFTVGDEIEGFYRRATFRDDVALVARHLKSLHCKRVGVIGGEDDWQLKLYEINPKLRIHPCRAPKSHHQKLWLRRLRKGAEDKKKVCALVWFNNKDAPEKVKACGQNFTRVGAPDNVNVFVPVKTPQQ